MAEENSTDNLSTEQTDKLLYFQEITHIDSIDECKHLLEACNWNIELAVQSAFGDPVENHANNNNYDSNLQYATDNIDRAGQNETFNQNTMNQLRNYSTNSSNNLPVVNILTQRTFSYYNQDLVPRGLFQWGYFLIAFPFRFLYSTFLDIISYFWNFFETNDRLSANNYDPLANIAEFAIDFNKEYGALNHPVFYEGSYAQAVNQAKKDFKFLLVYLHQKDNADCRKLAQETLGNQELKEFVNNTFIFWACSTNLPEGRKVFNALKAKRCPFLGLIVMRNTKMTLVARIEGPITATELSSQLNQITNDYQAELITARHDRETYNQTQLLREQQDKAYAESLRLDQEKARKQRELEEEKKRTLEEEKKQIENKKTKRTC